MKQPFVRVLPLMEMRATNVTRTMRHCVTRMTATFGRAWGHLFQVVRRLRSS